MNASKVLPIKGELSMSTVLPTTRDILATIDSLKTETGPLSTAEVALSVNGRVVRTPKMFLPGWDSRRVATAVSELVSGTFLQLTGATGAYDVKAIVLLTTD